MKNNNELPQNIQLYIKKWVKENSDKIQENLIKKNDSCTINTFTAFVGVRMI